MPRQDRAPGDGARAPHHKYQARSPSPPVLIPTDLDASTDVPMPRRRRIKEIAPRTLDAQVEEADGDSVEQADSNNLFPSTLLLVLLLRAYVFCVAFQFLPILDLLIKRLQ